MALSSQLVELLTTALRSRVKTVPELAQLSNNSTQDAWESVYDLQREGYLELSDDAITYRRPEMTVADTTRRTLTQAMGDLSDAVTDINDALESLPSLLQSWETGASDERTISGEVTHAKTGPGEAWMQHFARDTPKFCDISVPDLGRLLSAPREQRVAEWTAEAMGKLHVRLVIAESDARSQGFTNVLERIERQGNEIRTHPEPPSFFWVSDREVVGLPLHWGEAWPTSMLTVRSLPVAEAMAHQFTNLWDTATPFGAETHSWDGMLALMNRGLTMASAATRLGLAQRTARRRVGDAMTYYNVTSQFALGAAWGRGIREVRSR